MENSQLESLELNFKNLKSQKRIIALTKTDIVYEFLHEFGYDLDKYSQVDLCDYLSNLLDLKFKTIFSPLVKYYSSQMNIKFTTKRKLRGRYTVCTFPQPEITEEAKNRLKKMAEEFRASGYRND